MYHSSLLILAMGALGALGCGGAGEMLDEDGTSPVGSAIDGDERRPVSGGEGDVRTIRQKALGSLSPLRVLACGGAISQDDGSCTYNRGAQGYPITYGATDNVFPDGVEKIYEWLPPPGAVEVAGCNADSTQCALIVPILCGAGPAVTNLNVTARGFPGQVDRQIGSVIVPFEADVLGRFCQRSACVAPPAAPVLSVTTGYCQGSHRKNWTFLPDAVFYLVEESNIFGTCRTAHTVNFEENGFVPTASNSRVQACNECGCSGWSNNGPIRFYATCH